MQSHSRATSATSVGDLCEFPPVGGFATAPADISHDSLPAVVPGVAGLQPLRVRAPPVAAAGAAAAPGQQEPIASGSLVPLHVRAAPVVRLGAAQSPTSGANLSCEPAAPMRIRAPPDDRAPSGQMSKSSSRGDVTSGIAAPAPVSNASHSPVASTSAVELGHLTINCRRDSGNATGPDLRDQPQPLVRLPGRFHPPGAEIASLPLAGGIVLGSQLSGVELVALDDHRARAGSVCSWRTGGSSVYSSDSDDDDDNSSVVSSSSTYADMDGAGAASGPAPLLEHERGGSHVPRHRVDLSAPLVPQPLPPSGPGALHAAPGARGVLGIRNVLLPGFARAGLLDDDEDAGAADSSSSSYSSSRSGTSSYGGDSKADGMSCADRDDPSPSDVEDGSGSGGDAGGAAA